VGPDKKRTLGPLEVDTATLGLVLLRIGWSGIEITDEARRLLVNPGDQWTDVAHAAQEFVLGN